MARPQPKAHALEADAVREHSRGRWAEIYRQLAPELARQVSRPGSHGPCPFHGTSSKPSKDGFRFYAHELGNAGNGGGHCNTCGAFSDGFKVLMELNRWKFPEVLLQVASVTGYAPVQIGSGAPVASPPPKKKVVDPVDPMFDLEEARRRRDHLDKVWTSAVTLDDPTARPMLEYLKHRGIDLDQCGTAPRCLRLHPRMIYRDAGEKKPVGFFPVMLGLFTDPEHRAVSLHRTYLSKFGRKADVPQPKKMMARLPYRRFTGGGVRLYDADGPRLHVAEGIENSLAVRMILAGLGHAEPVWATCSTAFMQSLEPPQTVKEVWFWVDKDRNLAGQLAAEEAVNRLAQHGILCRQVFPPIPIPKGARNCDFLDLVREFEPQVIKESEFGTAVKRMLAK